MRNARVQVLPLLVAAVSVSRVMAQLAIEPEVRRAIPVSSSGATYVPAPTPTPVLKALPAGTPAQITTTSYGTIQDLPGSIRIAPSQPQDPAAAARTQLAVADGFYSRKEALAAIPEYEKFLVMVSKDHPDRPIALFRLGECQRSMGNGTAAESTYRTLLETWPSGPLHPAAAYRLGEILEARNDFAGAAPLFAIAAKDAVDPSVRQAATYHQASCLEKSGKAEEAQRFYLTLVTPTQASSSKTAEAGATSTPSNPYLVPTLLHLASNSAAAGNKEEALGYYTKVVASKPGGEAQAEASMKAALLLTELGRQDEARTLLSSVASAKDSGTWKEMASLGLLRMAASSGDDETVIRITQDLQVTDDARRPEILFLRAEALRHKGRQKEAADTYDALIGKYPADPLAAKASFSRLLALRALHSPTLSSEIDRYLSSSTDPSDKARAQLLKAETTLEAKDYAGAAILYGQIDTSALPASAKPDILYKQAWSLLQAGDRDDGTKALTLFIDTYPSDERSPAALAQRAMLKQEAKDFEGALADFDQLVKTYPQASERELALQQQALLLGQLQRNDAMVAAFTQLLQEYPKSKAAPQAHYWTGWAAFESKDYNKALPELKASREGDAKQFGERAGLRILLCQYYLGNAAEAAREASALKPTLIPSETARWLGQKSLESGDKAAAERFLTPLVKPGMPGASDPEIEGMLAAALAGQGKFQEAQAPAAAALRLAGDPASRARALLVSAEIQRMLKNLPAAQSQAEEALLLQPEGPLNTDARILCGDILVSRQDYPGAAKAYMTAAVLEGSDSPSALKALSKAADAYHKAGNLTEEQKARDEWKARRDHASSSPSATSSPTASPTP